MVYIGTDFVFDGTKTTPYEPKDGANPMSVYGRSKLAGEIAVRGAARRHFIVRTAWLYGPGGNNFPEKIIAAAQKNPSLKVVHDEIGSPTHLGSGAGNTCAIKDGGLRDLSCGQYGVMLPGRVCTYDFRVRRYRYAGHAMLIG